MATDEGAWMLEMVLAAVFVAVALIAMGTKNSFSPESGRMALFGSDDLADLPCPWCRAQTRESDNHCPSCGQPFG